MWTAPLRFVPTIILWHFDAGSGRRSPHHFRRQFLRPRQAGNLPIATAALDKIGALYGIEDEFRGEPADARRTARQQSTKPIQHRLSNSKSAGRKSVLRGQFGYVKRILRCYQLWSKGEPERIAVARMAARALFWTPSIFRTKP